MEKVNDVNELMRFVAQDLKDGKLNIHEAKAFCALGHVTLKANADLQRYNAYMRKKTPIPFYE